uniref:Signal transducing adaptor family member 2a n=1 Tax=Oryzias sinensis TaxID=183150 RepID=A0A8C8A2Y4_9TELE
MLKEVVDKERSRRRTRNPARAPPSPLSVPLVGEIPACFRPVSRTEAEVLLERHPDCGNMLLRPGRDGCSLAVTTRQDLNGSVFRHYRVTQRDQGGYIIDVENPIPCATLHDVIDALVEKTAGTLQPFLLEEPYEENITYVSANDENGEKILHTAPTSPLPKAPALPPKQDRWCTSPLSRSPAPDRRILISSVPASPTNPMRRLIHSPSPLTQSKGLSQLLLLPLVLSKPKRRLYCFFPALNEELKMTLEKRRVSQD